MLLFLIISTILHVNGEVYFKGEFVDDSWEEKWIHSEFHDEWGKFVLSPGKFYGDPEISKGIQTSEDASFYGLSTKFTPFSNDGKTLVVQFSVKHEQNINCGGGYIKLFDCSLDQQNLHGDMPYLIMFGPDICGFDKKKVHVIFSYKNKILLNKRNIICKDDIFTHVYTLVIKPDNTYKVKIDGEIVMEGELEKDWDFLLPKKLKDPRLEKPTDWVDDPEMEDPNAKKPRPWDKPEYILDETAIKPADWDDDLDGEWEPPNVNNPEFKGEWKPKLIRNPNYQGPWIHPEIENPDYIPDAYLYKYDEICAVGFDLWQVKSGTIFDNILITDDELEAEMHAETTWWTIRGKEQEMKRKLDQKKTDTRNADEGSDNNDFEVKKADNKDEIVSRDEL